MYRPAYNAEWPRGAAFEYTKRFIHLDYVAFLCLEYIKKTGEFPKAKTYSVEEISELLKFVMKNEESEIVRCSFHNYIHENGDIVDYDNMASVLANRFMCLWYAMTGISYNSNKYQLEDIFAFFDEQPEEEFLRIHRKPSYLSFTIRGDYMYIWQSQTTCKSSYKNAETEYTKIISLLREGYYFSDIYGTPYNGGDKIMIRIKKPFKENNDGN
jgi:hypothetical protein